MTAYDAKEKAHLGTMSWNVGADWLGGLRRWTTVVTTNKVSYHRSTCLYILSHLYLQHCLQQHRSAWSQKAVAPVHHKTLQIFVLSHNDEGDLITVGGVIIMTTTDGLLLSVFIASSMSGWSGCFYLSVWQTGVCLIYSGLTQGQGHTV